MRIIGLTPREEAPVTGVSYSHADRRNGWYAYAHDAEGNQIGDAVYAYHKRAALEAAEQLAHDHGLPRRAIRRDA